MNIDIRTLSLVLGITNVLQVIAISLQYFLGKTKTYRGIGWWVLGFTSIAMGFVLLLLRDVISIKLITILSANALHVLGAIFLYIGIMRFLDKKENRGIVISIFAVFILSYFYYTYVNDDIVVRTVISSAAVATVLFLTSGSLFVNKTRSITASANFACAVFLFHGCFLTFRALVVFTTAPAASFFTPTKMQTATFLVPLIDAILLTFVLIIMINQRLGAEMREAKEHFELIFDTSPDVALITRLDDGRFININRRFTDLTGFTRDEVIGKSVLDINLWENPDDRQKLVNELGEKRICENMEAIFHRKDGSQIIGMISAKIIDLQGIPHIISVARDINKRKRAEEALNTEKQRFQTLSEQAPFGMVMIEQDGTFRYINPKFRELFGYELTDVPNGKTWFKKAYPDAAYRQHVIGIWMKDLETFKPGEKRPEIFTVTCKDGTEKIINFIAVQLATGEHLIACENITERRQTEEALKRSEEAATRLARENALIAEIGRIISSTPNVEEVYPLFSQKVMELIPCDRIVINLINSKGATHTIPYVAGPSVSGRQPGDVVPMAGTLLEKVLQSQKGIITRMDREEEVAAEFPGLLPDFRVGFRSGLTVPLISGGEVIGGLALRSKGIGEYTDWDLRLAEGIGNQIAGAITNAQLYTEQRRVEKEREKLIKDLQEALARVKQLSGMLPICSSCKKIRDDKGYWNQIEVYVRDHSEAEFTHGMCPECMKKFYPDFCKDRR